MITASIPNQWQAVSKYRLMKSLKNGNKEFQRPPSPPRPQNNRGPAQCFLP